MYECTIYNDIQFCKFLFGLHRKSDEGPDEIKSIVLSLETYPLSKIVILHGLLMSFMAWVKRYYSEKLRSLNKLLVLRPYIHNLVKMQILQNVK